MQTREQVENKYKWDLSSYLDNMDEDAFVKICFEKIENLIKVLPTYKGKLSNKEMFIERLTKYKADSIMIDKLGAYIGNILNVDASNVKYLQLSQKFDALATKLNLADSFFDAEVKSLDDQYLLSLLNEPRLKDNDNFIKDVIKTKPHILDEKTSELLAKMGKFLGGNENIHSILTNAEMKFADALDSKGKAHPVDNATYVKLISSNDGILRKNAFISHMEAFKNFNKTFAELYLKDIELDTFAFREKKFDSLLEEELFGNDIPKSVFDRIVERTNKNIPILQKYVKSRAINANNKDFAYYDLFEDKNVEQKIDIEESKKIILSALAPMGEEYLSIANRKLNDHTIDFMPNQNKSSGAYCSNTYDADTVILMNYTYDYDSLTTLIHELGHCVNAEYFNHAQPFEKSGITIFAAEIASTVNEVLLTQYMINNAKSREEKIYYLENFLETARSTIFRQILFTEFELYAHKMIENEEPITYEELNNCYQELNKKYYGDSCIMPELMQYEWERVPHFYSAFYVYAYATGMTTAISIACKILQDKSFSEQYIKFLKNGTNKPAIEMLKEIGIDLTTAEPFDTAFEFINKQLDEYIALNK